jgi:hypothetical protein
MYVDTMQAKATDSPLEGNAHPAGSLTYPSPEAASESSGIPGSGRRG